MGCPCCCSPEAAWQALLGRLLWTRCRHCGLEYCAEYIDDTDEEE
jgi:hypothetical protein